MQDSAEQDRAPPVNNLLQPDLYNRLDAQLLERTRVINTQLDDRLRAQHSMLAKYRVAAERWHRREKERVRTELARISARLPAVGRIPDFRHRFLYGEGPRRASVSSHGEGPRRASTSSQPSPRPHLPPTRKIRGVPEERVELPFCQRFFIHHLPSKKKYYAPTPSPPLHVATSTTATTGDAAAAAAATTTLVSLPTSESGSGLPPSSELHTQGTAVMDDTGSGRSHPAVGGDSPRTEPAAVPSATDSCFPDNAQDRRSLGEEAEGGLPISRKGKGLARRTTLPPIDEQTVGSSPKLVQG